MHPDSDSPVAVTRGLHLRAVRKEDRSADFVASTDAVDSYGEIVEQKWDLTRYEANPVVLFAHHSRDLPIGTATSVGMKGGALECSIRFASEKANPLAEHVWQSICEGTLRAVSVGFNPKTTRYEMRDGKEVFVLSDNELFEISVTPIPANPDALQKMRAKAHADTARETSGQEKSNMDHEKEIASLKSAVADRDAKLADLTAKAAAADAALAAERQKLAAVESQSEKLAAERDALAAQVKAFADREIENDVNAIVSKKITPAQREEYLEIRRLDAGLFARMVAKLTDLPTAGASPVSPDSAERSAPAANHDPSGELSSIAMKRASA